MEPSLMEMLKQDINNRDVISYGYVPLGAMPACAVYKETGQKIGRCKKLRQHFFKTQR